MVRKRARWECTEDDCEYHIYLGTSNAGMEALDHLQQEHGIGTLERTEVQ